MKRLTVFAALMVFALASYAQQPHSSLTPMQQEMLKLPGEHLCGDAVTNVSCDELAQEKKNNYQTDPANAHAPSMADIARWTPAHYARDSISQWSQVLDSDQAMMWFAFVPMRNPDAAQVVVKTAYKGISGGATGIDVLSGQVLCGVGGTPPDYMEVVDVENFSGNGAPMSYSGVMPTLALTPGTNLAEIVQKTCKAIGMHPVARMRQASLPPQGHCSEIRPPYPPLAARMRQQGTVDIGFSVDGNGHPHNLSIASSSGFPDLDNAALNAAASAICNAPSGTHETIPITFGLSG